MKFVLATVLAVMATASQLYSTAQPGHLSDDQKADLLRQIELGVETLINSVPDQELMAHAHLPEHQQDLHPTTVRANLCNVTMNALNSTHVDDGSQHSHNLFEDIEAELLPKLKDLLEQYVHELLADKDVQDIINDASVLGDIIQGLPDLLHQLDQAAKDFQKAANDDERRAVEERARKAVEDAVKAALDALKDLKSVNNAIASFAAKFGKQQNDAQRA